MHSFVFVYFENTSYLQGYRHYIIMKMCIEVYDQDKKPDATTIFTHNSTRLNDLSYSKQSKLHVTRTSMRFFVGIDYSRA